MQPLQPDTLWEAPEPVPAPEPILVVSAEPVLIAGPVATKEVAADVGSYITYQLAGTEDKIRVLPQDNDRVRAFLWCSGTGPVWLGTEAQCAAIRAGNTLAG